MSENVAAVERAFEDEDPWKGFSEYVRQTCREQASDK
jgi:hypothetical protein